MFAILPAVPPAIPQHGATTQHINRLDKLRRQCTELRFIATYHPLDTRSPDNRYHINQREAYTWAACQTSANRLRPTTLTESPTVWADIGPPRGAVLDGIITSIEHELRRRAQRAKAERTANWSKRMRDPSGRGAALYARAADNSPTVYLRTPGQGPPGQPVHGPDPDVSHRNAPSGPTAHLDPDDESDTEGSTDDIGAAPANSILADTKAMLALMVHTWEPILARYRHSGSRADEAPPTWEDFKREYERELPTPTPATPFTLTDELLIDFIRRRPARRAGGLDGWTTREAKDLPDPILCLFAQVLRAMQRTGHVPEPLLHIPSPCLRKGKGELPTDQRLLSVMSVWMYAWEAPSLPFSRRMEKRMDVPDQPWCCAQGHHPRRQHCPRPESGARQESGPPPRWGGARPAEVI